jgi:hypothetical protein
MQEDIMMTDIYSGAKFILRRIRLYQASSLLKVQFAACRQESHERKQGSQHKSTEPWILHFPVSSAYPHCPCLTATCQFYAQLLSQNPRWMRYLGSSRSDFETMFKL